MPRNITIEKEDQPADCTTPTTEPGHEKKEKAIWPRSRGLFSDLTVRSIQSMVRITKKITAARESESAEQVRWIPQSSSPSSRMAMHAAEQWRNRQRSQAALRLNRQLRRA